ncbi:MAG: hypothetical protein RL514_2768 [Verrucomicrobiota bacterium]
MLKYSQPFPLTPALSLRERENGSQHFEQPSALDFSPERTAFPPLPEGEGRGEGEGHALARTVRILCWFLLFLLTSAVRAAEPVADKPTVFVLVGAAGEEEFGKQFAEAAAKWEKVATQAQAKLVTIGRSTETNDLARFKVALEAEAKDGAGEVWLVLLGHGTFDGKEARFNLRGPDLGAGELAEWLKPFKRPVAVVNCASASGPFINKLAAPGRIVVTATRSGQEVNFTRFGGHFADAISTAEADLDKDGQTSLLEAYLVAANRVAEFYNTEGRLATEHALLDDNGDGLGTPPDWFRGVRAVKKAKEGASADGLRAHQFVLVRSEQERKLPPAVRAKRDELELAIGKLRDDKSALPEPEYYKLLEPMLLDLARLYQSAK